MSTQTTPNTTLAIEDRPLDAVIPYPDNPRNNDQAVEAVARSIQTFGFRQPIVVDGEGVIIVGHTRWKAAQHLGLETVPVHIADLTPDQARAYRLADNKTNEIADWDHDRLVEELLGLRDAGADLATTGFSPDEIEKLTADEPDPKRISLSDRFGVPPL